jgi:adenylyl cyclase-associated protein
MSIDKCDGCQLFISKAVAGNPDFQVVTAKSSEVNVVVMADNPEKEDAVEHAVPEQFVSNFKDGKLVTTAASHGGG